ncbi:MAG: hypothetical protein GC159_07870 [Phycisphaera sp.]|nr:hypothetical protein [Phycisphaera sp.]
MEIPFTITPQPDLLTCGPACLHAMYRHFGVDLSLEQVIDETRRLPGGGTLAVMLALHAMQRGYGATIYTCDLRTFDPTWFGPEVDLVERLRAQAAVKARHKLRTATEAYIEFLEAGGELYMNDITDELLVDLLSSGIPFIAGLNATWLYQCVRERQDDMQPDDLLGEPTGHFVVVHGLDRQRRTAHIADPFLQKPEPGRHHYEIGIDRLVGAILLGIVTYDAKLLILTPPDADSAAPDAATDNGA